MEVLKAIKQLCIADERQELFVIINHENETYRPRTMEDVYAEVASIKLTPEVPEDIQSHFSTSLNLLAYSWYHYPFNVTAQFMSLVSVERALKDRLKPLKRASFKQLVRKAVDQGLVTSAGFSHLSSTDKIVPHLGVELFETETDAYCRALIDVMPALRNGLAHGSNMLHPNGARAVRIAAEFINQLYGSSPGGGEAS